jgi:DNA-binding transcriptional regulator YiaG
MDVRREIEERRLPPPPVRRAIREASGIPVVELAEELGISKYTLYHWEVGRREPRGAQRKAYAAWLAAAREVVDV